TFEMVNRMNGLLPDSYPILLSEIKNRIRKAQYEAFKAVNKELIALYWDIGRMIVERQRETSWGKAVVENPAKDLQTEIPGIKGFSARNLWNMRDFYRTYQSNEKLQPLVAEIGWTHNLLILEKCKDDLEREFYIRMARKFGWTKNVLVHQIENQTYEKTLLNQSTFDRTVSAEASNHAKLAVKDEYTFDFLEMNQEHSERELERGLIGRIEHFLREMGGLFAFVGSQYRLEVEGREFFIDLLLYHRRLRALVALELIVGEFQPEYVGKMQFYLAVLDDLAREEGENPSIGIILCKTKKRTIVEYALRESNNPIGVSRYRMFSSLPADLQGQLPDPEQIAKLLGHL
ncbi:MAG: PDDEXK nuclease domain-containing protein, partial [Syntrophobacteraceae bacterium]|nr:PDDEXK nuclease domain-containing protein [Syntrophobacteraceae bacterium]